MKNSRILLLFIFLSFQFSCDTDDDSILATPPASGLTFNLETNQDQMGDFFCNSMAVYDEKIWSTGGDNSYTNGMEYSDDVWTSADGIAWVSEVDNLEQPLCGHTLTVFDNKLWLIGGENNAGDWQNHIANSEGISSIAPFGAVAYHQTVVFNNRMYVIAGDPVTENTKVWSTDDGTSWIEETPNAFSGRVSHKAVVFNNAIYIIGGENISSTKLNEIWRSTNGRDWTLLTNNSTIFPGINGHTATVYNNKVWVIGGRTATDLFTNDIYYSSDLENWTKYDGSNPLEPLVAHNTLYYNDALWVFGGRIDGGVTGKIWSIRED
ncbi:Kelch repeat-containing protein [Aquimarina litoralis]